jgi:hypothetical protein
MGTKGPHNAASLVGRGVVVHSSSPTDPMRLPGAPGKSVDSAADPALDVDEPSGPHFLEGFRVRLLPSETRKVLAVVGAAC